METIVCSIFSGGKTDVCASVDLLLELDILELNDVSCSLVANIDSMLGVVGSVGGCKVVVIAETRDAETGLDLPDTPVEAMLGEGVSPVKGPSTNLSSGRRLGMMV